MTALGDLRRDYRTTFLRHLGRRDEHALHAAYRLGRGALAANVSLLQLVQIHHDVLIEVLEAGPSDDVQPVGAAASSFLLEVLASYDMAQQRYP